MSRTFRRKNFEAHLTSSWCRRGWKTNGVYTTYDGPYDRAPQYRPMTDRERYLKYRSLHGESSHANERSPGRGYRYRRQHQNRSINKQELVKWVKAGGEYEPMFEARPRSHWWDWS